MLRQSATTMKTYLRSLSCAAVCGFALSSCVVYDEYGYGGPVPVSGYATRGSPLSGHHYNSGYYDNGYYGSGYSSYSPLSLAFYGSSPYYGGYGRGSFPYSSAAYCPPTSRHYSAPYRPQSSSYNYAARVTRPSTFRGMPLSSSSPPAAPSFVPRSLPRPSFSPAPSPRMAPSPASRPSFTPRSAPMPAPSGRAERPASVAATPPAAFRSAAADLHADRRRTR